MLKAELENVAAAKIKGKRPLRLRLDKSKSIRWTIHELIEAAFERQKECRGMMVAGAVMKHLVGAKFAVALPKGGIKQKGFCVADRSQNARGDFVVGDTVVHVTTAPTEALIRKCAENLADNFRPLIITTETGVGGGQALAKDADIHLRIDILEIEQFLTTNIYEWTGFIQENRETQVAQLLEAYNRIIDECETDPSLKISLE